MTTHCFTSISFSYLNRARVLGASLRRHHPDWKLWLCITDKEPPGFRFEASREPFDILLYASDLGIDEFEKWLFKHNVVEACTAVKGIFLQRMLDSGAEKVVYLDPDIAVFGSLQPIVDWLDNSSVLLTPHQLHPESETQAIVDNEICSLNHGIFNLGFVAVRNDGPGRQFTAWWRDRCMQYCFDQKENGIFVDQKWCDLAPALFDGVRIIRDPGYNVASWNLSHRIIAMGEDGYIVVNSKYPLRFYHFTKLGPIGDTMTRRYAGDNVEVYELWTWYKHRIVENTDPAIPSGWWWYGRYASNEAISDAHRRLYRDRLDLQSAFPTPFSNAGFLDWLNAHEAGKAI